MVNRFDRTREALWGTPGFMVKRSTITTPGSALIPGASWIIETVRNDEGWAVFLQAVDAEGGQRIVVPNQVAAAIFRHYEGIMAQRRKMRALRAAETTLQRRKNRQEGNA